jgi:hypothetical protein
MVVVAEFSVNIMNTLLLGKYVRLLNWVVKRLTSIVEFPEDYMLASEVRELQKLYFTGKDKLEIAELFLQEHPKVDPEIVHLVIDKLAEQNGGLSYMDRFLATLF